MRLEEEAQEFLSKKKPSQRIPDKTAFRFYLGNALSGFISQGGLVARPEEVLNEAVEYALLAIQKEKELLDP